MRGSSTTPASELAAPRRAPSAAVAGWLVALAAALYLPFAPCSCWWLAPVSLVPLLALAETGGWRLRTLAALVFAASIGPWLALEWWIGEVSLLGLPVLGAFLAAWTTIEFVALRSLRRAQPSWPTWVVAPVSIVSIEWLRGAIVLNGYPWFSHGVPLVEWPVSAQIADLSSASVLTAACAVFSAGAWAIWSGAARRGLTTMALTATLVLAYGGWRLAELDRALAGAVPLNILVVQTNLPTSNKLSWPPAEQLADVARWARLTKEARARMEACDLVVWPETMVPGLGIDDGTVQFLEAGGYYPGGHFREVIDSLATAARAPLLVGSHATEGLRIDDGKWAFDASFNSAYLVKPDRSTSRYDKVFLTPFGETMPIISHWEWLEEQLLALGASGMSFDLERGRTTHALPGTGSLPSIATPICFEDTMSWVVRELVFQGGQRQAGLIVNLSNDGWFGHSVSGREHHLQMARARAIENRSPLVRCANTGTSCLVDAAGRLAWTSTPLTECATPVRALPVTMTPPFAAWGDVLSPLMLITLVIGMVSGRGCWLRSAAVRRPLSACVLGAASMVLASFTGCESGEALPPASGRPWSTKSASIVDPDAAARSGPAALTHPAPVQPFSVASDLSGTQNATDLLLQATASPSWELRSQAVQGLSASPAVLSAVCERLMGDPHPSVRYATCIVIGQERLGNIVQLTRPLLLDPSPSVRAAALFALARCGEPVDLTPVGALLLGENIRDRSNAAYVLGRLGNPSALALLKSSIQQASARSDPYEESIFFLQVAEAMVLLGDDSQLDPIRASLFQPENRAELIGLGCQIVENVRDRGALSHLHRIMSASGPQTRPLELRLVATTAWVRLGGQPLGEASAIAFEGARSADPVIRAQATFALGAIGTREARAALSGMLSDVDPRVQVAAAAAIIEGAGRGGST